jgi:hypothetical protein
MGMADFLSGGAVVAVRYGRTIANVFSRIFERLLSAHCGHQ